MNLHERLICIQMVNSSIDLGKWWRTTLVVILLTRLLDCLIDDLDIRELSKKDHQVTYQPWLVSCLSNQIA